MTPYIYKKTIVKTGKSYIGKHNGKDLNYKGSGSKYLNDYAKYVHNRDEDLIEEVLEYVDDESMLDIREEYWLNKFDVKNNDNFYNLINKSHGGNRSGISLSKKIKDKISKSKKGTPAWNKGLKNSWSHKTQKGVIQLDSSGNFIEEFNSIKEAAQLTESSKSSICNACKGKIKSSKGYIWVYSDTYSESLVEKRIKKLNNSWNNLKKKIKQIDVDTGDIIKIWNSTMDAHRELGINNIDATARGKQKTAGGYVWEYVN